MNVYRNLVTPDSRSQSNALRYAHRINANLALFTPLPLVNNTSHAPAASPVPSQFDTMLVFQCSACNLPCHRDRQVACRSCRCVLLASIPHPAPLVSPLCTDLPRTRSRLDFASAPLTCTQGVPDACTALCAVLRQQHAVGNAQRPASAELHTNQ